MSRDAVMDISLGCRYWARRKALEGYFEEWYSAVDPSAWRRRRRWQFTTASREDGRAAPALTLRRGRSIYQCVGDRVRRIVAVKCDDAKLFRV